MSNSERIRFLKNKFHHAFHFPVLKPEGSFNGLWRWAGKKHSVIWFHITEYNNIAVFKFPNRKFKSIWWMPWIQRSDEGRSMAAIRFGEVPSNLRSENVRMRKLNWFISYFGVYPKCARGELKHFSTRRKRKQCSQEQHYLSSGERKGMSPNLSLSIVVRSDPQRNCKTQGL